jgi:pSer/pThr/pTyr-binding forkhead associated (FHA) protein
MVEIETPLIYVIDLKQSPEISIGRNLESLMIINELSVSRKHCKLVADRVKKELVLVDNGGKFGTGVETNRIEVSKSCELQKGRTKMKFTKTVKLGLLERIGFCSPQENLGTK